MAYRGPTLRQEFARAPADAEASIFNTAFVPTALVWLVGASFLIPNAQLIFGQSFGARVQLAVLFYVVFIGVLYGMTRVGNPLWNAPIGWFLLVYGSVYAFGSIGVATVFHNIEFQPPQLATGTTRFGVMVFAAVIVAFPEEMAFRDGLPALLMGFSPLWQRGLTNNRAVAQLWSAFAFMAYHAVAYNSNPQSFLFAFIAGLLFAFFREVEYPLGHAGGTRSRDWVGLAVCIGLHAVYDSAVFGVLSIFNLRPADAAVGILNVFAHAQGLGILSLFGGS